ncbi:hypothetical protein RZS08_37005, partial [Arthrospira platensis SPKY1]|nr:hypothetical protein [Arthrospira platensis SPKY1]
GGVPARQPPAERGRGPGGAGRQPLPLHRLPADRRGDAAGGRGAGAGGGRGATGTEGGGVQGCGEAGGSEGVHSRDYGTAFGAAGAGRGEATWLGGMSRKARGLRRSHWGVIDRSRMPWERRKPR